MRILLISLALSLAQAGEYKTSVWSAEKCLRRGRTHCLAANLKDSGCCDYDPNSYKHKNCVKKYKLCSHNMKMSVYKEMTMPPLKCPNKDIPFTTHHTQMGKKETIVSAWTWQQSAILCRFQVTADHNLDGKIQIRVTEEGNESVAVLQ